MDEAAEGKKLRRLAKDYSKGLLSNDVYRQERANVIEAFNRDVLECIEKSADSSQTESLNQVDSVLESEEEEIEQPKPSNTRSVLLFLSAFIGGLLLGYAVLQLG